MNDEYVLQEGMSGERLFALRLMKGFNFAPITADAVLELSKEFFLSKRSGVGCGQILYLAVSDREGPGKSIVDSDHKEVLLSLDSSGDMEVYEKYGLSAYRQYVLLRVSEEAREQGALLTVKDLVKLLKSSYSTIKRDVKVMRGKGLYVPLRGIMKDIGPTSHKSHIVDLFIKGYTTSEIQRSTWHSLKSVERYVKDFSRVSILTGKGESVDNIRLIVGISERLVKEYQELYNKYKDGEHSEKIGVLVNCTGVCGPPMTFKKTRKVVS